MPWNPGQQQPAASDPDWWDWFVHPQGGNSGSAPVAPTATATQPVASGNSPTAPAPKASTPQIDYTGQRRSEYVQNGALTPEQMAAQNGFVQTGPTKFVSLQQNATFNYNARDNLWIPGYAPSSADRQQAAKAALQSGATSSAPSSAPTPGVAPSSPPTPGAAANSVALNAIAGRGGLFSSDQSLANARALGGNYLPGKLIDLGTARDMPASIGQNLRDYQMITQLPQYQGVAGGPGRSGFSSLSRSLASSQSAPSDYAAYMRSIAPSNIENFSLLEPAGYSASDPYANGMPSVPTSYYGSPANLSIGTAGAEIRGGTAGGWGGDAGAILAAHGIQPSNDPMANAAMAAAIASGQGQFSFGEGNAPSDTANVYGSVEGMARGGTVSYRKPLVSYADGGMFGIDPVFGGSPEPNPRLDPAAPLPAPDPYNPNPYPLPPFVPPVAPTAPAPNVTSLAYDPAQQAISNQILATDRLHNLYGYRNQLAGLPQDQAIQLGQGEVPGQPAPQGYYYRNYDPLGTTRAINNDLYSWTAGLPIDTAKSDYYKQLDLDANTAATLARQQSLQQSSVDNYNARMGYPSYYNPYGAIGGYGSFGSFGGFADGGMIYPGASASVTQQPNGRKSMVTPEPISMIGQQTGTPYGQMGEVAPEAVTMQPNGMRIDPIPGASYNQPQQPQSIIPISEYKFLVGRNPAVAAALAQMEMSGKPSSAMMEMTLGRIEGISDNAVRQRALAAYGGIVNAVNQGRQAPPLAAPGTKMDPVGIAAALKFAGEGMSVA